VNLATRDAEAGDYAFIASLFPELAVPDPFPSAERFAVEMRPTCLVALVDGVAAGYGFFRVYGPTAHVLHVVVGREQRGRRVGEALLRAMEQRARSAGCTRWYLNVKSANAAALRLYRRLGFAPEATSWALRVPWSITSRLPTTEEARSFRTTEADDARLAARFGLTRERVAMLRTREGTALVALQQEGSVVAFAAFDASYPGAYPFRAVRGSLAGPLLRALEPLADRTAQDFVYVTVEDDEPVRRALEQAGAEVLYEVLRMSYDFTS
jgi:GNAT superfamily N-acetyltransferase